MNRIKTKDIPKVKAKLLKQQGGCCVLCKMPITEDKDKCLDHCHVTGVIRAVLCRNCNAMEGKVFNCARRAKRNRRPDQWLNDVLWYWNKYNAISPNALLHPSHKTADEKRVKRNKKAVKARKAKKAAGTTAKNLLIRERTNPRNR